jgi:hypothetical protein
MVSFPRCAIGQFFLIGIDSPPTAKTLKPNMRTYEELLQSVIRYIYKHGKTQAVIDKVETMLPDAWSANIIADALDQIASR